MDEYILFDVGANWGNSSLEATKNNLNFKCWAFEPTPELVIHLRAQSVDFSTRYAIIDCALSDFDGLATFNLAKHADWGCSSLNTFSTDLKQTWPERTDFYSEESIVVEVKRFDTWYREQGLNLSKIDYFHCDAQGSDLKILKGMGDYINLIVEGVIECASSTDVKLYTENHTLEESVQFLNKKGFKVKDLVSNDIHDNEFNLYFEKVK